MLVGALIDHRPLHHSTGLPGQLHITVNISDGSSADHTQSLHADAREKACVIRWWPEQNISQDFTQDLAKRWLNVCPVPAVLKVEGRSQRPRVGWGWDGGGKTDQLHYLIWMCWWFPLSARVNQWVSCEECSSGLLWARFTNQSFWFRTEEGSFLQAACYWASWLNVIRWGKEIQHMPQQPPLTPQEWILASQTGCRPFQGLVAREQLGSKFASGQLLMLENTATGN